VQRGQVRADWSRDDASGQARRRGRTTSAGETSARDHPSATLVGLHAGRDQALGLQAGSLRRRRALRASRRRRACTGRGSLGMGHGVQVVPVARDCRSTFDSQAPSCGAAGPARPFVCEVREVGDRGVGVLRRVRACQSPVDRWRHVDPQIITGATNPPTPSLLLFSRVSWQARAPCLLPAERGARGKDPERSLGAPLRPSRLAVRTTASRRTRLDDAGKRGQG
jgi:hypothetical protein